MNRAKLFMVATALTLPLLALDVGAQAATTHNLQTRAETKNSYDTRRMANMKQPHRMMHRHHHHG